MMTMIDTVLTDVEVRVLASLVEKEITTPEYYPLSLNALTVACNQKSNREPVVNYDNRVVAEALDSLRQKGLARTVMGGDSRVPKNRHYFGEGYELTPPEVAVLNVLMLRGPQTVGEIRGRSERLHVFADLAEVEATLEALASRATPLVRKLPRQSGRKDHRYVHLLAGEPAPELLNEVVSVYSEGDSVTPNDRIAQLEEEVRQLRQDLELLQLQFLDFMKQFE